jgi:hypothetical protein
MRLRGLTIGVGLAIAAGFLACESSDEIDTQTGPATGRGEGVQPPGPPAPPASCDRDCVTRAREAFVACTQAPGADEEACRRTYVAAGQACGCAQPAPTRPPPATCDQACATGARDAFATCSRAPGADQRACRATFAGALEACGCQPSGGPSPPGGTPPPPPGGR